MKKNTDEKVAVTEEEEIDKMLSTDAVRETKTEIDESIVIAALAALNEMKAIQPNEIVSIKKAIVDKEAMEQLALLKSLATAKVQSNYTHFIYDSISKSVFSYSEGTISKTIEYVYNLPEGSVQVTTALTEMEEKRMDIVLSAEEGHTIYHIESESGYKEWFKKGTDRLVDIGAAENSMLKRMLNYKNLIQRSQTILEEEGAGQIVIFPKIEQLLIYINKHPKIDSYKYREADNKEWKEIRILKVGDLDFYEMRDKKLYGLMLLIIANRRSQYGGTKSQEKKDRLIEEIVEYVREACVVKDKLTDLVDKEQMEESILKLVQSFGRMNKKLVAKLKKEGLIMPSKAKIFDMGFQKEIINEYLNEVEKEKKAIEREKQAAEREKQAAIEKAEQEKQEKQAERKKTLGIFTNLGYSLEQIVEMMGWKQNDVNAMMNNNNNLSI
ncbi:hypothetical protein [Candidatus Epulonipiscium viviparus]|uniref:hypothetical protein n=1 Tax=Candidatus Epulonipiscium viviparus TaxID=420336 RepID=UPI002738045B|nr:hypothetical protein [Candidatus Epulopiscium viviparus]